MTQNDTQLSSRPIIDDASLEAAGIDRRDFMRVSGTLAASTAIGLAGCQPPAETSVPFNRRPENLNQHGKLKIYSTVLEGVPVRVRCREGRPIGIVPNPESPRGRGLTVRTHAALLDLYDPDRATGPLFVQRGKGATIASGWNTIGQEVVRRMQGKRGDVVFLTGPNSGPSEAALFEQLNRTLSVRRVSYAPISTSATDRAWRAANGAVPPPRPRLDRADLIVGFGAEFIDQPADGLEGDFAQRRDPTVAGGMSRFVQLEGRLTLTGANADQRIRVRDSQLATVAAAVAHEIIIAKKHGPLAGDRAVTSALEPYSPAGIIDTGVGPATIVALANQLITAGNKAVVLAGGSASATAVGLGLEAAVLLINESLGSFEGPAFDREAAGPGPLAEIGELEALAAQMGQEKVSTLIIAGPNPVYDAPIDFAAAMASVDLIVSLNDRLDETSALADYLAPASHALESWGDAELGTGLVGTQQPVIRPLYDTHGMLDVLVAWGAAAGAGGSMAAAAAASRPAGEGNPAPEVGSGAYHYIRAHWLRTMLASAAGWDVALRLGHQVVAAPVAGQPGVEEPVEPDTPQAPPPMPPTFAAAAVLLGRPMGLPGELELQLYPHFALHDGRAGNNGWLHELPDPITRLTWGGAVSVAPRRFDAMGLTNGDLLDLESNGKKVTLPAYRHAGMHGDQIAVPLGLGRAKPGVIGEGIGVNAFDLQTVSVGRTIRSGLPVTIHKNGGHRDLALGQGGDVVDRRPRPIVPTATLTDFEKNPKAGTEQVAGGPSAWPEHPYQGQRWGMAIDLSKCNGCGKCTVACQAENNIPVVGRQAIIDGREMSWLRIDRYYDAPPKEGGWDDDVWEGPLGVVEEPVTLFEPMLCQHCENAPCETVCPFNATMHSADGLNQQIYNRCVGTRYCANNCPFKVRRYNWYEYSTPQNNAFFKLLFPVLERHAALNTRGRMQMKNNPEVTVRSRGVMEKCSFCVQRIREARAEATRRGEPGKIPDGAVLPACMESCPTGAIVFGDINDPKSRVSALFSDPRAMRLLESTGVKPVISYLTKVRNDHA